MSRFSEEIQSEMNVQTHEAVHIPISASSLITKKDETLQDYWQYQATTQSCQHEPLHTGAKIVCLDNVSDAVSESDFKTIKSTRSYQNLSAITDATTMPLLDTSKVTPLLKDWPSSPSVIKKARIMTVRDGVFDFTLFVFAVAFLAFAISVVYMYYDQTSTVASPKVTNTLLNATKYVSAEMSLIGYSLTSARDLQFFPYCLL